MSIGNETAYTVKTTNLQLLFNDNNNNNNNGSEK